MRCTFLPLTAPDESGKACWQCSRCGRQTAPTPHQADRIFATCKVPGWGDYVTYWLALFGITKARVKAVLGEECGCEQRSAALNTAGERWRRRWKGR